jgi:hypothetical protein
MTAMIPAPVSINCQIDKRYQFMTNILEPTARPFARLLRRRKSVEYFKESRWTKKAKESMTCSNALEAAEACVQHELKDVGAVLRMSSGVCDIFCSGIR